jgi:hypothetical protein
MNAVRPLDLLFLWALLLGCATFWLAIADLLI